jgi:hypothetical protein
MKSVVKNLFLRGPILHKWTVRKARRLEERYGARLIGDLNSPPNPNIPQTRVRVRTPLRRLLFIADCMWESEELVPELARIAPVTVLNLHPHLDEVDARSDRPSAVVRAIERFTPGDGIEPDAILFYSRGALLSGAAFDALRRRWKAPLIGMNLDDKAQFFDYNLWGDGNDNYQRWARFFDLNLTSSILAEQWYRKLDLPVLHCPMGFCRRPENEQPPTSSSYKYTFSFVGSRRLEREQLVAAIRKAGLPLTLFGNGWPASTWAENPTRTYRESQLNLGFNSWSAASRGTNPKARDFECPGAGACYLTSFNWELAQFYDVGREILCWASFDELIEIYSFYAPRPEDCLRIAQAAHRRSANEHAWEHRFRRVFSEMGFN